MVTGARSCSGHLGRTLVLDVLEFARAPVLHATQSDPRQNRLRGYVKSLCYRFYADEIGRPGLRPGRYFCLPLIGYFEGLDVKRAIAPNHIRLEKAFATGCYRNKLSQQLIDAS